MATVVGHPREMSLVLASVAKMAWELAVEALASELTLPFSLPWQPLSDCLAAPASRTSCRLSHYVGKAHIKHFWA